MYFSTKLRYMILYTIEIVPQNYTLWLKCINFPYKITVFSKKNSQWRENKIHVRVIKRSNVYKQKKMRVLPIISEQKAGNMIFNGSDVVQIINTLKRRPSLGNSIW